MFDPKKQDPYEEAIRAHEDVCRLLNSYYEARNRFETVRALIDLSTHEKLARFNQKLYEAAQRAKQK